MSFIVMWYLTGVVLFCLGFWVEEWLDGTDLTLGDVFVGMVVSVLGPLIVFPLIAALNKRWPVENITLIKGRARREK